MYNSEVVETKGLFRDKLYNYGFQNDSGVRIFFAAYILVRSARKKGLRMGHYDGPELYNLFLDSP